MRFSNPRSATIPSLILASSVFSAMVANAALISFTTGEGYVDGTLNGQVSGTWGVSSNTNVPFAVNTTTGSVNLNTTLNTRIAGYNQALNFNTAGGFSSYIDFSFVQETATLAASSTAAGLIFADTTTSGSIPGSVAAIGRTTTLDGYRLVLGSSAISFAGSSIGINSTDGDNISDVLRMTLNLSQGSSSSTWIASLTLFNVTQNAVIATRSSTTVDIVANDPTTIYNALYIGATMASSGISSFSILDYSTPTAIPEPSSLVLLNMGVLAMFHRRRKDSSIR